MATEGKICLHQARGVLEASVRFVGVLGTPLWPANMALSTQFPAPGMH
jgi:hypothetical protein